MLCHFLPYFRPYFHSGFAESSAATDGDDEVWISIDAFSSDGIEPATIIKLVTFAYSGTHDDTYPHPSSTAKSDIGKASSPEEDINEVMSLLVAANRFGFSHLIQICEKKLLGYAKDSQDIAHELTDFANYFNFPSLQHSIEIFIGSKFNCGHWQHAVGGIVS